MPSPPAARPRRIRRRPLPALDVARTRAGRVPQGAPATDPISVVLIANHPILREGTELLRRAGGVDVVGAAASAEEGLRLYETQQPDVAVVDLGLRAGSGLMVIGLVLDVDDDAAVLASVSAGIDGPLADAAAAAGARGFTLQGTGVDDLLLGIQVVARGGVYLDPGVTKVLSRGAALKVLSPREQEILELLAAGLTGAEAASSLSLSSETVRTHIRNAMRKLDVKTRVHAVTLALSLGEISATHHPV